MSSTNNSSYFVYILRGPRDHIYIGTTSNIEARIQRHQKGEGAEFTKRNKTFQLVYKEEHPDLLNARKRETQIKKWRREKKEYLIKYGKPFK
ncbi:MAG: GIY-YIG nuclease family protein [Minisyncoccia bacterium]